MNDNCYVQEGEEKILCLYFNSFGFGYTVMENPQVVLDKGMVHISPVSNTETLIKVKRLIRKFNPKRIVIEDHAGKLSHKRERITKLLKTIKTYAGRKGIQLSSYSREQIRLVFDHFNAQTRYEIAEVIERNVPSFENLLFDKPKYPLSEHYRSALFDSASLGVTHYFLSG